LRVEGRNVTGTYVEVGVPFFVCFHDNPNDLPVRFLGRAIRRHADLAPRGANVDFVSVVDEQRLYFRVYERGVEDETLSSGTGSLSAALAAAAAGNVESPVACEARGATLTVRFRIRGEQEPAAAPSAEHPQPAVDQPVGPEVPAAGKSAATEPDSADPKATASEIPEATDPPIIGDEEPVEYVALEIEGEVHRVCRGEAFLKAYT
jgi:hypothetical protein